MQILKRTIISKNFLSKRITVMLDDEIVKKLHELQAKQIRENSESVSFSGVLNETLRANIKK
ncbi:MAG: hypothetical protein OEL77_02960 [Nitrosopumilus sp.]|nr:hypothetical protein [Nitrosopumilus sp.]MDH3384955.1 hypothetical protein [Nitrosopumilus sp.]